MKIGCFDSGSGGLSTLSEIRKLVSEAEYYYIGDIENHPYGNKSEVELCKITRKVVQKLNDWGAKIVVIACNTATTRCIHELRKSFPGIVFVGTEPAIKVARDAGCQNILLLATPSTIKSEQVKRLIDKNIDSQRIDMVPCPGLADLIEKNVVDINEIKLRVKQIQPKLEITNEDEIRKAILKLMGDVSDLESIDGVVLGCTHYILVKDIIQDILPQAKIIDGNSGVARYVRNLVS